LRYLLLLSSFSTRALKLRITVKHRRLPSKVKLLQELFGAYRVSKKAHKLVFWEQCLICIIRKAKDSTYETTSVATTPKATETFTIKRGIVIMDPLDSEGM
jgi:hypothetical protein